MLNCTIGPIENKSIVCVVGELFNPAIGKEYSIEGEIIHSPVWGEQISILKSISIERIDDNDYRGQRYILKKIFPKYADKMYEVIDNPYLALKNKDVGELIKIKGCGTKRASQWIVAFEESYPVHKAYLELARCPVSDKLLDKIIDYYKGDLDKAIDAVKNNPYNLIHAKGIGWKIADTIALNNGMEPFSVERISTCIRMFLSEQSVNGKSYSTPEEIMAELIDKIGEDVPDLRIAESLHLLKERNVITWNKEKTRIGLTYYFNLEHDIAKHLLRLKNAPNKFIYNNWRNIIADKERQQGWEYTSQQIEGIKMVLDNQVSCISGYGGTGKTSIIDGILTILQDYCSVTVALAGRAASRVAETSHGETKTIHKLLSLQIGKRETIYDYEKNPLEYDIIIIDEMSMIDGKLYLQLLKSIATGTKVIFIGDVGQLESIGSCAVAADMLDSPYISSIFLDKIHRQAQKSAIITESIKVRQGKQIIPKDWSGEETRGYLQDMIVDCYTDKSNTYHEIVKHFKNELKKASSILDIQIIIPCKKGVASVATLNNAAQYIYNPHASKEKIITSNGNRWILRLGDKVINKTNLYGVKNIDGSIHDIFNGNIGIIRKIQTDYMTIEFQGIGYVDVPNSHLSHIELGYAITCHSAQGSQFPIVIGGLDFSMYVMLSKELLYTMITRASEKFILVAQNNALRYAVMQHQIKNRQTYLLDILEEMCNKKFDF